MRELSLKLLADLKEACERLNQNSQNSSRPPSQEAPWEKSARRQHKSAPKDDAAVGDADAMAPGEAEQAPHPPASQADVGVDDSAAAIQRRAGPWSRRAGEGRGEGNKIRKNILF